MQSFSLAPFCSVSQSLFRSVSQSPFRSVFRRAPVRKVIAKIVTKTTPTTKSSPKKATEGGGGGGGGKRKRGEMEGEGGRGEVKKTKTEAADLAHYEHYPRLTRSAYRSIERLGPGDSGPIGRFASYITSLSVCVKSTCVPSFEFFLVEPKPFYSFLGK